MRQRETRNEAQGWRDSPTSWFAVLEWAVVKGDRKTERQARTELARLGVGVLIDRELMVEAGNQGKVPRVATSSPGAAPPAADSSTPTTA